MRVDVQYRKGFEGQEWLPWACSTRLDEVLSSEAIRCASRLLYCTLSMECRSYGEPRLQVEGAEGISPVLERQVTAEARSTAVTPADGRDSPRC